MTEHEKMVGDVRVKLEAITVVIDMLGDVVNTNPIGGTVTAIQTIVESIEEILNSKEGNVITQQPE